MNNKILAIFVFILVSAVLENIVDFIIGYERRENSFWSSVFHDVFQIFLGMILITILNMN